MSTFTSLSVLPACESSERVDCFHVGLLGRIVAGPYMLIALNRGWSSYLRATEAKGAHASCRLGWIWAFDLAKFSLIPLITASILIGLYSWARARFLLINCLMVEVGSVKSDPRVVTTVYILIVNRALTSVVHWISHTLKGETTCDSFALLRLYSCCKLIGHSLRGTWRLQAHADSLLGA